MSATASRVSVDLAGAGAERLVGYRAKRHTGVIDVERRGGYDVARFLGADAARADESLILDPDEFYILASKEAVQVPPDYAAEMVPFDPLVGEFRVHYAGFFDPGFGYAGAGGAGARAVLEVRSREVPFILEHGQIVGRLVYEKMLARPDHALRQRHRLELPGAGPEAVEAFPGVIPLSHGRLGRMRGRWRGRCRTCGCPGAGCVGSRGDGARSGARHRRTHVLAQQ